MVYHLTTVWITTTLYYTNIFGEEEPYQYIFVFKDNGIGIPGDQIPNIFDMFSTCERNEPHQVADQSGTGLGLATVQKIVSRFGGEINVKSEVGVGSEYRFSLNKYLQPKNLITRESK